VVSDNFHCESCDLGTSKRQPVSRASQSEPEVLEVIESDTQGPFPVKAIDGTCNNVKFIDANSERSN
jgi:hypothetical protein